MKGGNAIAKEVQAAHSNSKKLADTAKALNGQFAKTPTALKRQVALLKELQGNTKKWKDGTVVVTKEWKKVEEAIKRGQRALRSMSDGGGMGSFLSKLALVQTAANLATAGIMALGRCRRLHRNCWQDGSSGAAVGGFHGWRAGKCGV